MLHPGFGLAHSIAIDNIAVSHYDEEAHRTHQKTVGGHINSIGPYHKVFMAGYGLSRQTWLGLHTLRSAILKQKTKPNNLNPGNIILLVSVYCFSSMPYLLHFRTIPVL